MLNSAYKYVKLADGLLAICEKVEVTNKGLNNELFLECIYRDDGMRCILVGESCVIEASTDIFAHLKETKRIFIAESGFTDSEVKILWFVDLDDYALGRLSIQLEQKPPLPIEKSTVDNNEEESKPT